MGAPHRLTPAGQDALEDVVKRDLHRREVRRTIEAAAARLIADTCAASERDLGEAVARALREGVPHTRVGRGMGTRDWGIVDRFADLGNGVDASLGMVG